jgi:exodeoxyribonuclease V beta subunit
MKPFDLLNAPLEGINLIEAGAGTGKTYNIEGLFIRLVLEMQLQIDQILVLTFTNAATEELKDRIRTKLVQAKDAFGGRDSDDPLIASMVKRQPDPKAAELRLHDSLIDFDKAAIFTIHGFCQRVLHENAFETHNLFDTELITNQAYLIQEVVDDFWRKTVYSAPLEFISFALNRVKSPEYFYRLLDRIKTLAAKIVPDLDEPALESLDLFRESLAALKNAWPASREAVFRALKDPNLSGVIYGSLKPAVDHPEMTQRDLRVMVLFDAMDRLAVPNNIGFPLFDKFERFTSAKLIKSTKKNHSPPDHVFFDLCENLFRQEATLKAEMENYLLFLKAKMFTFAAFELQKRKKENNIQYFDDLLITLMNALQSENGDVLGDAIRQKYRAALVDEFQDTDSIQYDILTRLFSHNSSLLFMIGDPKQAIYSFRGADIFSYMKAARRAAAKFTLTENWRSQPNLITAVNTIFGNVKAPFVYNEIPFEKGKPAKKPTSLPDIPGAPLILWYLDPTSFSPGDKLINKADAVRRIANAVGDEISRLISGPTPIEPGDIAVLVRTNKQAQLIKDILSTEKVPSVLYSTGNIFDSHEAYEVEKILIGIAEPTSISPLKAALATDIMGMRAKDLATGGIESHGLEARFARIREYHQLWDRYGFIRMFRMFLARERIRERLLGFPDGERRLTNVMHLAEILHRYSMEKSSGMAGLLKWLAEQRNPQTARLEEYQLRLESDEKAVQIVTIHKSKGLEYPVVFCPFGWESSRVRNEEFTFHDIDDNSRLTLDLGSELKGRHLALAQNELLSENLRLLYVALTRASERCYLAWGRIRTAETSALAYLLHCGKDFQMISPAEDLSLHVKKQFTSKTDAEFVDDLKALSTRSQKSIQIKPLPMQTGREQGLKPQKDVETPLFCRKFDGRIDHSWRISSFSSLISASTPDDVDLPDRDIPFKALGPGLKLPHDKEEPHKTDDDSSIFSFPRGTRAGIFFHDIFEHHDFASKYPNDLGQLVSKKLQQYGFDRKWEKTVCQILNDVLSVPLRPGFSQLKLSSVQMSDRINEVQFYFPLKPITSRSLAKIFEIHSQVEILRKFPAQLEKLVFLPSQGFMKGYIDMVFQHQKRFYLVDWKSNYLGSHYDDYRQPSLHHTMQTDYYILQYHLYTLALHKYLQLQKLDYRYEDHFGGVFYIFIRGVHHSRGSEYGIFYDLPDFDLIRNLGNALIPSNH